jgi:hypothetical protein
MAKFSIRNITGGSVTLPQPYDVLLPAGRGVVVEDTEANILAYLGGPAQILGTLRIEAVSSGNPVTDLTDPVPDFQIAVMRRYARTTGNDDGNGSAADPYRSFQRLIRDAPEALAAGGRFIGNCKDLGTETLPLGYQFPEMPSPAYSYPLDSTIPYYFMANAVTIQAELQLVTSLPVADAKITVADAPVITDHPASKHTIVTVAARASWTPGLLKGKQFFRTIGGFVTTCTINDNSTTQLFLDNSLANVPALVAGEEFHIGEPSFFLEAPAGAIDGPHGFNTAAIQCNAATSINFQGVGFRSSDPFNTAFGVQNGNRVIFEACDIDGIFACNIANELGFYATRVRLGTDLEPSPMIAQRSFMDTWFFQYMVSPPIHTFINCSFDTCVTIANPVFVGSDPQHNWGFLNVLFRDSQGDAVRAQGGSIWYFENVLIKGALGRGIVPEVGNPYVELTNVQFDGNAGLDVDADDGAKVQVHDVVTGTSPAGGSMQSGALASRTWADFYANAPVGQEFDLVGMNAGALLATGTGTRIFQKA